MALGPHWGGFGVAMCSQVYGFVVALGSHWGGFTPFCPAFGDSRFGVRGSMFRVYHKPPEYTSSPASPAGRSGGTLDIPWTCPGTIEATQTPVFDQPSLSRPLSSGISATERLRSGRDLWSVGAGGLRFCGPCGAKLVLRAALTRLSALCILPWGRLSRRQSSRVAGLWQPV